MLGSTAPGALDAERAGLAERRPPLARAHPAVAPCAGLLRLSQKAININLVVGVSRPVSVQMCWSQVFASLRCGSASSEACHYRSLTHATLKFKIGRLLSPNAFVCRFYRLGEPGMEIRMPATFGVQTTGAAGYCIILNHEGKD